MSTEVKHRRGTTAELLAIIPASGEIVQNTESADIHIGDGLKQGGHRIPVGNNAVSTVPTILAMKSVASLSIGDTVHTKGYHLTGDGGGTSYIIEARDGSLDDGGSVIFLDNGLQARLQIDGGVGAKQFGAKCDGVTDDTVAIINTNTFATANKIAFTLPANSVYDLDITNAGTSNNYANGAAGHVFAGVKDGNGRTPEYSPALVIEKHSSAPNASGSNQDNGFVVSCSKNDLVGGSGMRSIYGYLEQQGDGGGIGIHGRARTTNSNARIWGMWAYADRASAAIERTIGFESNCRNTSGDSPYDTALVGGGIDGVVSATVDSTGICNNAFRATQSSGGGWRTAFESPQNAIAPAVGGEGEICRFGGASSSSNRYGGIRFYAGNLHYGLRTMPEVSFENKAAIWLAREHKIVWNDTVSSAGTYITYSDTNSRFEVKGNAFNLDVGSSSKLLVNGVKVLAERRTGYGSVTGTTNSSTWSTSGQTTDSLAEKVGALWDALRDHGLIGS